MAVARHRRTTGPCRRGGWPVPRPDRSDRGQRPRSTPLRPACRASRLTRCRSSTSTTGPSATRAISPNAVCGATAVAAATSAPASDSSLAIVPRYRPSPALSPPAAQTRTVSTSAWLRTNFSARFSATHRFRTYSKQKTSARTARPPINPIFLVSAVPELCSTIEAFSSSSSSRAEVPAGRPWTVGTPAEGEPLSYLSVSENSSCMAAQDRVSASAL